MISIFESRRRIGFVQGSYVSIGGDNLAHFTVVFTKVNSEVCVDYNDVLQLSPLKTTPSNMMELYNSSRHWQLLTHSTSLLPDRWMLWMLTWADADGHWRYGYRDSDSLDPSVCLCAFFETNLATAPFLQ